MEQQSFVSMTEPNRHRFHFLDALRGMAAIIVMFRHAPEAFTTFLRFPLSYLAVDFFFCLSGFVVAFSYERRLNESMRFRDFSIARAIRLYPIATLGTLIITTETLFNIYKSSSAGATLLAAIHLIPQFTLGLLIIPNFLAHQLRSSLFPLGGVMWTLFFELLANLTYAGLVRNRFASSKLIFSVAAISGILLAIAWTFLHTLDTGFLLRNSPAGLLRVGVSFSLGVLVYRYFIRRPRNYLNRSTALTAGFVVSSAFVFLLCNRSQIMEHEAMQFAAITILFPCIVLCGAHIRLSDRWTSICAFLGNVSYPLYILHGPLYWPIYQEGSMRFANRHAEIATVTMLIYASLLIFISWCVSEFYDLPTRRFLTALARKKTGIQIAQQPKLQSQ